MTMDDRIENIPLLYQAPFWAAYGALEGGGIDSAIIRQDIAEEIVAALLDVYEMGAGKSGPSARIDNAALPGVVTALVAIHGRAWILRPAVYAAARVLTVG